MEAEDAAEAGGAGVEEDGHGAWHASAEAVRRMPRRRLPDVVVDSEADEANDDEAVSPSLRRSKQRRLETRGAFASGGSTLGGTLLTYYGACRVAWIHLLTWESLIVSVISALSVVLFTFVPAKPELPGQIADEHAPLAAKLSLVFISFVIVFPITASIQFAFQRRERALDALAGFRINLVAIMIAHRDWDWPLKDGSFVGREVGITGVPLQNERHVAEVRTCLVLLVRAMRDYLALPLVGRSRHLFTTSGAKERARIRPLKEMLGAQINLGWQRLSLAVEALKSRGLPGNEAARLNQYMQLAMNHSEVLRNAKSYRTPQALRAFARLYIIVHVAFAGPYYAWVSLTSSFAFSVCLSIFTAVSMVGLQNVAISLEDPFDQRDGLDDVRVSRAFADIERQLMVSVEGREAYVRGDLSLLDVVLNDATDELALPEDLPFQRARLLAAARGGELGPVASALAELSAVHEGAARRFWKE